MKIAVWRLVRWSWYALGVFLVLFALLVSLGQYYFPRIGDYKEQILAEINARAPFAVAVGRLSGEWTGLAPTITLRDLRVYAPGLPQQSLLVVPLAEVRIDLVPSAIARTLRVRELVVDYADASL